jgi:hypothetical protein
VPLPTAAGALELIESVFALADASASRNNLVGSPADFASLFPGRNNPALRP